MIFQRGHALLLLPCYCYLWRARVQREYRYDDLHQQLFLGAVCIHTHLTYLMTVCETLVAAAMGAMQALPPTQFLIR